MNRIANQLHASYYIKRGEKMKPKFRNIILTEDEDSYLEINPLEIDEICVFTPTKIILKVNGEIRKFKKDDYMYYNWTDFYEQLDRVFDL
jgi:hypothetical protein